MSWVLDSTLYKTEAVPDLVQTSLLKSKIDKLKQDPKWFEKLNVAIDESEKLKQLARQPLEDIIKMKLIQHDRSPQTIKLIQSYALKYLNMSQSEVWPIDGIYGPKTRLLEQVITNTLSKGTQDNNTVTEIKSLSSTKKMDDLRFTLVKWWILKEIIIWWEESTVIDEMAYMNYVLKKDRFAMEWTDKFKNIDNLSLYLNTAEGRIAVSNSMKIYSQIWLWLQLWLWIESLNKKDESVKILNYSDTINKNYLKLQSITNSFESERKNIEDRYSNTKDRFAPRNRSRDIDRLWEKLKSDIWIVYKDIAKTYLKALVDLNPTDQRIWQNDTIPFSIWLSVIDINLRPLNKEITKIKQKGNQQIDKEQLKGFIDTNIDKFMVDWFIDERFRDIDMMIQQIKNNKWEFAVNAISVIAWAIWTWAIIVWTRWTWAIEAWLTYTAIHDTVRSVWYWVLYKSDWKSFTEWMKHWIWYNWDLNKFVLGKTLEVGWNIVLFKMFWLSWRLLEKVTIPGKNMSLRDIEKEIHTNLKAAMKQEHIGWILEWTAKSALITWLKVTAEWHFFTWFQMLSWSTEAWLQSFVKSWGNPDDFKIAFAEKMSELAEPRKVFENIVYNMTLISMVRWGMMIWENIEHTYNMPSKNMNRRNRQYLSMERKFVNELRYLEGKWFSFEFQSWESWTRWVTKVKFKWQEVEPNDKRLVWINHICNNLNEFRIQEMNDLVDNFKSKAKPVTANEEKWKKPVIADWNKQKRPKNEIKEEWNWNLGWKTWPKNLAVWEIRLDDFMKGLDYSEKASSPKKPLNISPRFAEMLEMMYNKGSKELVNASAEDTVSAEIKHLRERIKIARTKNESDILVNLTDKNGKSVKKRVKIDNLESILWELDLNMKKDFKDALELKIKNKPLDSKYWESARIEKMIWMFKDRMNPKAINEISWTPGLKKDKTEDKYK
ncbi:MAG: hypothetical protein ACD_3C00086G0042 [uncultured bacterium (gcode 4)]|uniref:Uncharacterized protein n=1 Tax=uncultured bacterium (gcode 4) TaxID=1234023 RepID=K2FZ36_9BACT|nr:MAG: hypothetical protein ACD_3C00086G0042 [uncultured bacterium (gcode 4)]